MTTIRVTRAYAIRQMELWGIPVSEDAPDALLTAALGGLATKRTGQAHVVEII